MTTAVPENATKALEAQLAHRPDVQDLIDRNIIKGKLVIRREGKRNILSILLYDRPQGCSCYSTTTR